MLKALILILTILLSEVDVGSSDGSQWKWKNRIGVLYSSNDAFASPYADLKIDAATISSNYNNKGVTGLNMTFGGLETEIYWYDIAAVNATLQKGVEYLINSNATVINAPIVSAQIGQVINLTESRGVVVVCGMSADTNLFRKTVSSPAAAAAVQVRASSNFVITMTPADNYLSGIYALLKKKGAKTVAYLSYSRTASFDQITTGSFADAIRNSLTIVSHQRINSTTLDQERNDAAAALKIIRADSGESLDLLIVATNFGTRTVPRLLRELDFNVGAVYLWEHLNAINNGNYTNLEKLDAQYFLTLAQSDFRLIGKEYTDDSSRQYATYFVSGTTDTSSSILKMQSVFNKMQSEKRAKAGEGNSSYTPRTTKGVIWTDPTEKPIAAAVGYNSLFASELAVYYVIDYLIGEALLNKDLTAQSSTEDVRMEMIRRLGSVNLDSFYGPIVLDRFRANSRKPMVILQLRSVDMSTNKLIGTLNSEDSLSAFSTKGTSGVKLWIVSPDSSTETIEPIFPMPKWSERLASYPTMESSSEIAIVVIVSLLLGLCVITAIAICMRRNSSRVKAASLSFTLIIVLGCCIQLAGVLTWMLNSVNAACRLRMPILLIGFTTTIWSMIIKCWRIVSIFDNKSASAPRFVMDRQLWRIFAGIEIFVFLFLVVPWVWLAPYVAVVVVVDPLRPRLNYLECGTHSAVDAHGNRSTSADIMQYATIVYLLLSLAILAYLASRMREVYENFNESRPIVTVVANTLLFAALFIIQAIGFTDRIIALNIRSFILIEVSVVMLYFLAGYKVMDRQCFRVITCRLGLFLELDAPWSPPNSGSGGGTARDGSSPSILSLPRLPQQQQQQYPRRPSDQDLGLPSGTVPKVAVSIAWNDTSASVSSHHRESIPGSVYRADSPITTRSEAKRLTPISSDRHMVQESI
jgi:hypothetical protein